MLIQAPHRFNGNAIGLLGVSTDTLASAKGIIAEAKRTETLEQVSESDTPTSARAVSVSDTHLPRKLKDAE